MDGNDGGGNDDAGDDGAAEEGETSRSAIPLIAGAIILAQVTMSIATIIGDKLTENGIGRKFIFLAGLITLPIRCALIIYWKDAGNTFLLSTQILDGLGGGFFGLMHPYLVADITFGTGRFNLISEFHILSVYLKYSYSFVDDVSPHTFVFSSSNMSVGMTASCFGLGGTMSNFLGQMVVEKMGHVSSLLGSFFLSFIPIVVFSLFMPETKNTRGHSVAVDESSSPEMDGDYVLA